MFKGYSKIRYVLSAALLLCGHLLFGQDIRFVASVSKNQVGTGEPFEVSFAVNSDGDRFSPPDFSGFQLLSGPNQSTSMSSINGTTSMSTAYSYDLVAVKEGTFVIGAATMVVNGRKMTTSPIRITVVKGRPVPQNGQSQGGQLQNGPDNSLNDAKVGDLSKTLFLRAVVDKNSVYQGEPVTLNYRVYTRASIGDSRVDKLPDLNGFYSQDVKSPQQQVQWKTEVVKGQRYNTADIKQVVLFAQHAGNITIDPFAMTFIVRVAAPSSDPIEQFFGGSFKDVKYAAKSLPVVIHIKSVPEAGKPAGYSGAIGRFAVEARLDKREVKANETINYQVKISGTGNLKLMQPPAVVFPPDFEKYDPKITDSISENASGATGYRIYNYLLIPRHAGNFTIEPLHFAYFNPSTGKYIVLSTAGFPIKVNKGAAEANVSAFTALNKEDVKLLDKDIRYLKTGDPELSKAGNPFFGSLGYYLLFLAGPLACIVAFIARNRNRQMNRDVVGLKNRRAAREAAKHLATAQKTMGSGQPKVFYEAIFRGLYGYLGDKLNLSAADLNREIIDTRLVDRGAGMASRADLQSTLDLCEMARYSPVTHISEQEVFDKAKKIIHDIENEI